MLDGNQVFTSIELSFNRARMAISPSSDGAEFDIYVMARRRNDSGQVDLCCGIGGGALPTIALNGEFCRTSCESQHVLTKKIPPKRDFYFAFGSGKVL
jgi:hypothetical protein